MRLAAYPILLAALVGCRIEVSKDLGTVEVGGTDAGGYQHVEPDPQAYLTEAIVTADQLGRVRPGMTVEEVSRIMGRDGETTKVNAGVEHVWNNSDGSFASLQFVDGVPKETVPFNLK